jgi:hypothetical protein
MAEVGRRLNKFHDKSGLVTVSVFSIQARTPQQHFRDFGVNVSPEMDAFWRWQRTCRND